MEPHIKTTPKDFFLYAFAAGALYFCATTLITLLWQLINAWLPEATYLGFYEADAVSSMLRWAIALLIIVFPAYIGAMWWIGKDIDHEPAKRELWVRRWFIWATLFLAAITLLGDLVYLLYALLGGDVTSRFILKALSVAVVAAAVFGYHWYLLKRKPGASIMKRKAITAVASLAVLAAVVAGFCVVGSPSNARAVENDQERVAALQSMQYQVTNFWQQKQRLPNTAQELIDPASPEPLPVDPQTGAIYEYEKVGEYDFALCANFETDSQKAQQSEKGNRAPYDVPTDMSSWEHGIGETCFSRTIDPERYPPLNNL